jgi:response regulator NasT
VAFSVRIVPLMQPLSAVPAKQVSALEAEVAGLQDRLETRKAVERAKQVLSRELGLSEPDAFRWIQKTAMDLRLTMRQVAEGVIEHGPGIAGGPGV